MKVESLTGNNVKNRFGDSETTKFGIAEEAHGLIMKYLTDLYDDPILAAIRETISNAIDAHTESGTKEKVEIAVSSSSSGSPYFEVTDFGVGMSKEVVQNVYTQYGISTKRNDDDAIGGFGLGCKSPLAIEDRFYIATTQDGVTLVAEVYKNNSGEFVLDINDEYESGEPNGTTVRINLEKTHLATFHDKLRKFLKFVDPSLYNAVTSNGEKFKADYALDDKEKYHLISDTDEFKVYANLKPDYYESQTIVMGNVSYNFNIPASVTSRTKLDRESLKVVIVAPINSVTITTSRENTQDTKKTKLFLEKAYIQFENDINEYFQNYVDQAETPVDVYKRVREAQKFSRRTYKYKGKDIQDTLRLENMVMYAHKRYGSAPSRGNSTEFFIGGNSRIFLVAEDGTPETKEGAITRAYNAFLSKRGLDTGTFYFLHKDEPKIDSWWVTENPYIYFIKKGDILKEAAEYRKEQRKANGNNRRATGKVKYDVVNNEVGTPIDNDFIQAIEYPEIEKGIAYLTMDDIVTYGLARNSGTPVRDFRHALKNFLDFFDYTGEVLILDKGKKEETMLKRVKAEKLEFDFVSLRKESKAAKARAYLNATRTNTSYVQQLRKIVGEKNFAELKDPRFAAYLKDDTPENAMSQERFDKLYSIINSAFVYGSNDYYQKNQVALHELRTEWREMNSYYWYANQEGTTRQKIERLKGAYENHVGLSIKHTKAPLVVDIFNTVYDKYLTSYEKML